MAWAVALEKIDPENNEWTDLDNELAAWAELIHV